MDRLYVTATDGTKVGWRDLLTGEDHVADVGYAAEYEMAVAGWLADAEQLASTNERPGMQPVPAETAGEVSSPQAYEDLATRRAGAAARQQAVELREAAPVRTLLARVLGVHTDERAWRIGADGEQKVAAQLARLMRRDPRWRVLHAVPIGEHGSDIDHVVLGPGGVYTLNAKHHPGGSIWVHGDTFMVNGNRYPYVRNSRFEASRAAKLLSAASGFPVSVTGIVVLVAPDRLTIKQPPADIHIVNRMALPKWLSARRATVRDDTIETIYRAARKSTTWRPVA